MKLFEELEPALNTLLSASAQAALLVPLILLVQWAFKNRLAARWLHAFWWIVVLRLMLPFSVSSPLSLFNLADMAIRLDGSEYTGPSDNTLNQPMLGGNAASVGANSVNTRTGKFVVRDAPHQIPMVETPNEVAQAISPPVLSWNDYVLPTLGTLWALGVLALSLVVVRQSLRFTGRLRRSKQQVPIEAAELLNEPMGAMSVRRRIELIETDAVSSPVLYGLFRLRILLPLGFVERFDRDQLRHVLLHEVAHVRRRDIWANWLVTVLQVVHWFDPLVWVAFARMRADRELACDELALERGGEANGGEYGRTIVKLLEDLVRPTSMPGLVGILEDKKLMERRIKRIAKFKNGKRWSILALLLIAILGVVALTDAMPQVQDEKPLIESATLEMPRMTIQLLAAESEVPIGDAQVQANYFSAGGQMESYTIATDAEGLARLPKAASIDRVTGMNVFVIAKSFVPLVTSWSSAEGIPINYVYRLQPALMAAGTVLDEAGNPASNVKVNIGRHGFPNDGSKDRVDFHTRLTSTYSDSAGRWELPYLPSGTTNFVLYFNSTKYMATEVWVEMLDDLGKGTGINGIQKINLLGKNGLDSLKSTIYWGYTLSGKVVTRDGQSGWGPVPGARLREVHNWGGYQEKEVIADNEGAFKFVGLRDQPTLIVAEADGYSPALNSVPLQIGPNSVQFYMRKGPDLRGRVVDSSGLPIANVVVRTDTDNHGLRRYDWTGRTDSDGWFTYTNAPVDEVLIWIAADGFDSKREVPLRAGKELHRIVLSRRDDASVNTSDLSGIEFRLVEEVATLDTERKTIERLSRDSGKTIEQQIFVHKEAVMDAGDIERATVENDKVTGRPQIFVEFNQAGVELFTKITTTNVGRQIAILIDGVVVSAPHINEPITGGRGAIYGSFTREEAELIAERINEAASQ